MAKRRDRISKENTRIGQRTGRPVPITGSAVPNDNPAFRLRGRRGVRARARMMRMRQPSGGKITNSP